MMQTLGMLCFLVTGPWVSVTGTDQQEPTSAWDYLAGKYDRDKNGEISVEEYDRTDAAFTNLDLDGNGVLTKSEIDSLGQRRGGKRSGKGSLSSGSSKSLVVGQKAPDFELPVVSHKDPKKSKTASLPKEPEKTVKLSSFRNKKPVALIFGSYT